MFRYLAKLLGLSVVLGIAIVLISLTRPFELPTLPPLKSGDLILQTLHTPQSLAIMLASESLYTHVGIIKATSRGYVVIDSAGKVGETPLKEWIERGRFQRFTILRDNRLSALSRGALLDHAIFFYGKPYDYYFQLDSDPLYCSELPYKLYQSIGLSLGKLENIGSLHVNLPPVQSLIKERLQTYPKCVDKPAELCYRMIMEQQVITPASIARDPHMTVIFSNYPSGAFQ